MRAWLDAGGVYAIANLRGGGEEGDAWHRAGMREYKRNTFDDLHAAAGSLIETGWTTPALLGLLGDSNGGLLVGAALTQRPDLYAAAVCATALLDMIRYHRYNLGPLWTEEYGSAADPREFTWLADYSPYHHVAAGTSYPATLLLVAEGDTRVHPMHARKVTAALQHATASSRPILFHSETGIGHGPRRAASRSTDIMVDALAFLAAELGLTPPPAAPG